MAVSYLYEIKLGISGQIVEPRNIKQVTVTRDYLGSKMPSIIVDMQIDPERYDIIMDHAIKNKNKLQNCTLDIFTTTRMDNDGHLGRRRKFLNGRYTAVLENLDKSQSKKDKSKSKEAAGSTDVDRGSTLSIRLALFDKGIEAFSKGVVNVTVNNANIQDLLMYAFQECSKGHKLRMSPPDRQVKIPGTFIIPPSGFYQALEHIDKYTGIYETPYVIFTENNETYLLNTANDSRAATNMTDFVKKIMITGLNLSDNNSTKSEYQWNIVQGCHAYYVDQNKIIIHGITNNLGTTGEAYIYGDDANGQAHDMSHTIEVKTGQNGRKSRKRRKIEEATVYIDDLPVETKPYTIVMLCNPKTGKTQNYRIASVTHSINMNSMSTIMKLFREVPDPQQNTGGSTQGQQTSTK